MWKSLEELNRFNAIVLTLCWFSPFPDRIKFHISGTIKRQSYNKLIQNISLAWVILFFLYSWYLWFHSPAEGTFWLMTVYVMITSMSSGVRYSWASRSSNDITCVTRYKWIKLSEPQVLCLKRRVNNKIHLLSGFLWGWHQLVQIKH